AARRAAGRGRSGGGRGGLVSRGRARRPSGTICVAWAGPARSAAVLSGSGFGPASGGQTTAAITSPASSRPRSTCSAKAACPTRRTRIPGSALEMGGEEALEPLPRVARSLGLVRGALGAEEPVIRPGIHDHLGLLARPRQLGLQL